MMIDATTVKLRVHGNGMDVQWFDVKWFGVQLVTDAAVRSLVTKALGLPAGTDLVCRHSCDGSVVALGAAIPDGLLLDVHVSMTGCRVAGAFKKQLIKFENIQAHLANERTWLAWVRTSLSALSVAFSLLTLVGDSRESWLAVVLFILGSGFVVSVFTAFVTGWLRYARIRDVLMLTKREMPAHLHRIGVRHQARLIGILFILLTATYLSAPSGLS
jgi:uncharacterized membrane protein YidH (DUF202 family)